MNCIFLVGNLTGDIYYDRLRIKQVERPFLRLILMSSRPRFVGGMRVVLWDEKAELFFPYLQRGSEIAAVGHLQTREYKEKLVHEIDATNLILLRNVNWEFGETGTPAPQPSQTIGDSQQRFRGGNDRRGHLLRLVQACQRGR